MGVTVSEINIEMAIDKQRVTANSWNSRPIKPPMNSRGTNTAIRERLIESTVKLTSWAPFRAASQGDIPSSMKRAIFSITTMASSTTKPVETVNAMSERLLMLYPSRYIPENVPINEAVTATPGTRVACGLRRKTNTTATTSKIDSPIAVSTSLTEARMVVVVLMAIPSLSPAGMDALSAGSALMMRSG